MFVIVESGTAERLLFEYCSRNELDEVKRLYRHLREDTRLIANSLRPNNFEIINCAGTNVTAYSANSRVTDDTISAVIQDLTRPRLRFLVGLGATLSEARSALEVLRRSPVSDEA
ncbi:MAG TPA: mCpol domain-containing protein [Pseudorhizobium sp.]|jgi:hypothetical protein|nr:mCpol domain-containing protein [Pseudorhizobium sp.]